MCQANELENILLIEDDAGIADLIQDALAAQGKPIVHVTTGKAAREWLSHHCPQLILIDHSLPDMSGVELIDQIAALPNGLPPFIVTTGSGDERIAVAMMKRGARDYLIKDGNFLDGLPLVVAQVQKQIATERQRADAERALRESQMNYQRLFESIGDAIIVFDAPGHLLDCNQAALTTYGYTREELLTINATALAHPDRLDQIRVYLASLPTRPAAIGETIHRRKDGTAFPVELSVRKIDYRGTPAFLAVVRDITERKRAEEETAQKNKHLTMLNQLGQALNKLAGPAEILERISDLIGQVFDNRNLYIALYNAATNYIAFPVYSIAGKRNDAVDGRPLGNGLTECVIRTRAPVHIPSNVDTWLAAQGVALIGTPCQCYLGVPIQIEDEVIGVIAVQDYQYANVYNASHVELLSTIAAQAAIALANARLYETAQKELADRKRVEEQLRQLSTHDALTGIYNRAFFETELARLEEGREFPISIVIADVDNMKTTNDTLGHLAGDELLKRAAGVLQASFRRSDILARIGGDEFAVICPLTVAPTATQLLARIQQNVRALNSTQPDLILELSLGIATTTDHNLVETLGIADTRMYEDKRAHKTIKGQAQS